MPMAETMKVTYSHFPPWTEVLTSQEFGYYIRLSLSCTLWATADSREPGPQIGNDFINSSLLLQAPWP